MATMNISWHAALPRSSLGGPISLIAEPPLSTEQVTTSATPANSGAKPARADVAACWSDTLTHYRVNEAGGSDTAATSDKFIPANTERHIHVPEGGFISFRTA